MSNLLELYCDVDDFLKEFIPKYEKKLLKANRQQRKRKSLMSCSEIITLLIDFQGSVYKHFKAYYAHVALNLSKEFPTLLSYNRFVELIPRMLFLLAAYISHFRKPYAGIGFVDSTPIAVCHRKRIHSHRVFSKLAAIGKTTKGWFLGFKLHFLCNTQGEFLACQLTPGNVDDRIPLAYLTKFFKGKLFGDKDTVLSVN